MKCLMRLTTMFADVFVFVVVMAISVHSCVCVCIFAYVLYILNTPYDYFYSHAEWDA